MKIPLQESIPTYWTRLGIKNNMCIVLESPRGAETCPQVDLFKKYDHWETDEGQKPCDVKAVAKARAGKFHAMASK